MQTTSHISEASDSADTRRVCSNCKHLVANRSVFWCLAYDGDSPSEELQKLKRGQVYNCEDFEAVAAS